MTKEQAAKAHEDCLVYNRVHDVSTSSFRKESFIAGADWVIETLHNPEFIQWCKDKGYHDQPLFIVMPLIIEYLKGEENVNQRNQDSKNQ